MTALLQNFAQDLRFALRQLRRAPAFAATAVLTVALAIGIATAVFSVIDATLAAAAAVPPRGSHRHPRHPLRERLQPARLLAGVSRLATPGQHPRRSRRASIAPSPTFSRPTGAAVAVPLVGGHRQLLSRPSPSLRCSAAPSFPARTSPAATTSSSSATICGREASVAAPDILGSTLKLDGEPNTVVGVMPPGFRFPLDERNALYQSYCT